MWAAYHNRSISPQEQALYDHWLQCLNQEAPEKLIERFQALFIDGVGYPDRQIVESLDQILTSNDVDQYFRYILNRCCHILVNRWQGRPQLQAAIPALVDCFEQGPTRQNTERSRSRQTRKLRKVVNQFTETDHYLTLRRLARVIGSPEPEESQGDRPLGTLIRRYPYLYEHCLAHEDTTQEHQQVIRRIRTEAQHKFEVDLSQYVTYRIRKARIKHQPQAAQRMERLRTIDNPTLLDDQELVSSLRQFSGKVDNGHSYRDSASQFLAQHQAVHFGEFKDSLYDYLTAAVDPSYGNRKFNKVLSERLNNTFTENDDAPLTDFLVVRTCSQLLNFLVVDSPRNPHHFLFVDLINNLGPTLTTGILLKILLLCNKVKPYLERRFSILFNHYETSTRDAVTWLVKVLENLNIALSLTFGSLDVSHLITV
jgi:hypothetical protein